MDRSPAARDAVGTSAAMMVGGELKDSAAPSGDGGRGEGTLSARAARPQRTTRVPIGSAVPGTVSNAGL